MIKGAGVCKKCGVAKLVTFKHECQPPASKLRVDELKRRCADDFKRLKTSFEDLMKEAGAIETLKFAQALHVIDAIGLKLPW
jgi:hypothetical protein